MSFFTLRWLSKKCTLWRERAPIIVRSVKSQPSSASRPGLFSCWPLLVWGTWEPIPACCPACTQNSDVRLMLRRSSAAVATSREGHRLQRSGREGQHRRQGQARSTGTTQRGNVGNGPAKVRKCSVGPATADGACAVLASGPICFVQIAQAQPKLSLSPTSRTLAAAPTGRQTAAKRRKTPRNAQDSCDVMRVDM